METRGVGLMRWAERQGLEDASARLSSAVRLGDAVLCRLWGKNPFYADPDDESMTPHLAMGGCWEPWASLFVARTVKPGWRCLDVGANVGYYSVLMGEACKDGGEVVAVEPNPRAVRQLRRNFRVNGLAGRVWPIAASDRDGTMTLTWGERDLGCGCAEASGLREEVIGSLQAVEVDARRLDAFLGGKFDFVKIDCEGMDYRVLRGLPGLLRRTSVVTFEHCEDGFRTTYAEGGGTSGAGSDRLREMLSGGAFAAGGPPWALHFVDYDGAEQPASIDRVASEPARLWNLVLRRAP